MKPLFLLLLAVPLCAQEFEIKEDDPVAQSGSPKGVAYVTQEQVQGTLKTFTDDLPGFPKPPALTKLRAGESGFGDFKDTYYAYRERYMWNDVDEPADRLTPDKLRAALHKNAPGNRDGLDPETAGRWICHFASALRGYLHFYSYKDRPEEAAALHGGNYPATIFSEFALNKLTDRFKDVTKVDLKRMLHYELTSQCEKEVVTQLTSDLPKPIEKPKDPPPPVRVVWDNNVDFSKYAYNFRALNGESVAKVIPWGNNDPASLVNWYNCVAPQKHWYAFGEPLVFRKPLAGGPWESIIHPQRWSGKPNEAACADVRKRQKKSDQFPHY